MSGVVSNVTTTSFLDVPLENNIASPHMFYLSFRVMPNHFLHTVYALYQSLLVQASCSSVPPKQMLNRILCNLIAIIYLQLSLIVISNIPLMLWNKPSLSRKLTSLMVEVSNCEKNILQLEIPNTPYWLMKKTNSGAFFHG